MNELEFAKAMTADAKRRAIEFELVDRFRSLPNIDKAKVFDYFATLASSEFDFGKAVVEMDQAYPPIHGILE